MSKDFKRCPITESTYINRILKETREDEVAGNEILLNSLERINSKRWEKGGKRR